MSWNRPSDASYKACVFAEEEKSNLKLQVKFVAKNRSKRRFRQNVEEKMK
jgi:hypothetical protein